MRKRIPLIGCLKRNPSRNRFSIPNAVWTYKLKPVEFVLLSYLCCCHSRKSDRAGITAGAIARTVHLTVTTVKKHLVFLKSAEIITEHNTLSPTFLSASEGNFFTLPNEIFLLKLPSSAFMAYAYLLLIEDRRTHTCHPSYNTIAAATGISKNTAMKSIGTLLEMGLIAVEPSSYFDKCGMKWKGNNLYTILPTQRAVGAFYQQQLQELVFAAKSKCPRQQKCGPKDNADGALPQPSASGLGRPKGSAEGRF